MNYKNIYDRIISRGKNRIPPYPKEDHHIIPKCMNGADDASNIVSLTPEEHFLAHVLLVKIYPENYKLIFSVNNMCRGHNGKRPNRRLYGWLKRKFIEASKKNSTRENNSQFDTKWITDGTTNKRIKSSEPVLDGWTYGRTLPIIKSRNAARPAMANETKIKISNTLKGKEPWNKGLIITDEHKTNVSLAKIGKSQYKTICPVCNKEGGISNMKRYHFENCKF